MTSVVEVLRVRNPALVKLQVLLSWVSSDLSVLKRALLSLFDVRM